MTGVTINVTTGAQPNRERSIEELEALGDQAIAEGRAVIRSGRGVYFAEDHKPPADREVPVPARQGHVPSAKALELPIDRKCAADHYVVPAQSSPAVASQRASEVRNLTPERRGQILSDTYNAELKKCQASGMSFSEAADAARRASSDMRSKLHGAAGAS